VSQDISKTLESRVCSECRSTLDEILRLGAQQMLQAAIEAEVASYVAERQGLRDETGRRCIVRNGHLPERSLQSPVGPIEIKQPRVRDRRGRERFASAILPRYLRRAPSLDNLIPWLYLKGISAHAMPEALQPILGPDASGVSPSTVVRLSEVWQEQHRQWSERDLRDKRYAYWWVDGIYFNVRLSEDRPCLLVIVGALQDGRKELVAILDGERESKLSWLELLRDLKRRGVKDGPALAIGDGALGFWSAVSEQYPKTRRQRCWVHKTANVLDKMPKHLQAEAKTLLHRMYQSPTKAEALGAFDEFVARYGHGRPKAVDCLVKDKEVLFTFYDFPAAHWVHVRTTNPIESTFATVRHRHRQTKGSGSREATLAMVFQLAREAQRHWRRLDGHELVPKVLAGIRFTDGTESEAA